MSQECVAESQSRGSEDNKEADSFWRNKMLSWQDTADLSNLMLQEEDVNVGDLGERLEEGEKAHSPGAQ